MTKHKLSIRLFGEHIGVLEQLQTGKKIFTYDKNARFPISIAMPIQDQSYDAAACEAFFGGLLPESDVARKFIARKYGISANNNFSLLRAIGHDCAGAISCHEMDEAVIPQRAMPLAGRIVSAEELYHHIQTLPTNPLFMDVEGLRLSLAGVQNKAAICMIDNQIAFPEMGCPTTHILKPNASQFEGLIENEYFCLRVAKRIGLPVPDVTFKKIKDITFLLVERYDRIIKNKTIERVHQEDFCQASRIPSSRKYQNEGGPGLIDCFKLLDQTTAPAVDRNLFATIIVFNYFIGNMDAHAKNFSLLHRSADHIRLAPFYDIVSTRAYDNLTNKMAMKIGSTYHHDDVLPRHWQQLCQAVNYRYIAMINLLEEMASKLEKAIVEEIQSCNAEGISHPIFDKMILSVKKKIEKTLLLLARRY